LNPLALTICCIFRKALSCQISGGKEKECSEHLDETPFIDLTDEEIKEIRRIITEEKDIFRKKKDGLSRAMWIADRKDVAW
jgi:hypothetical protein